MKRPYQRALTQIPTLTLLLIECAVHPDSRMHIKLSFKYQPNLNENPKVLVLVNQLQLLAPDLFF